MTLFALLGAKALYLLYAWLLSAIIASYLSQRKGYGDRPGLASGLLLNALGIVIWLFVPAKPESTWKRVGAFKRARSDRGDEARDERPKSADTTERT
jgi:hypothetical protein